ncbi:Short-chain dehydrogenase/reductase SDR [Penicillium alfredii]|uniref:Short-chain dehydrogenase/reductase SDR n=1 Tax=Penicillium alfredii TaxID=1506179 RepID=A0A9W9JWT9_9EURO|nr:Short-chain dehydrogenase/reductase SDR [Penicillium alfredii]KAJ5084390.1 Short-chain dehydrogenase/reductase SDR [Penicillium alfredii]
MPYSLRDRNVLIIGGSRGLGALVAEKFAAEGSNVAINYMSSRDDAEKVASGIASQYGVKTIVIQGVWLLSFRFNEEESKSLTYVSHPDCRMPESKGDCANAVNTTIEQLGGLDIIISNAGWTKITEFADLDAMDDADWDKCWSVNVKSSLHLFKAALPTFNANPEGGAFIITSSTAGVTPSGSSLPYSVTKAAAIHLMKCLAKTQGTKVRVNAVLPGLLLTEWGLIRWQGQRFSPEKIEDYKSKAALKRVPEVEDNADMYINIAKNPSITGQTVQIDAGFAI